MARAIHKLTDIKIKAAKKAGRLSDGGNLNLRISATGAKSWSFIWGTYSKESRKNPRREIGIGSYPTVSLAAARKIAAQYREIVSEGGDPKAEKEKESEPIFSDAVEQFLATMESQWSNSKHRAQWRMTLTEYCKPISDKRISEIGLREVLIVLQPIWNEKPETASRLRGRIERVLNYAKVKGWREGENPALWRGNLENVLPKPRKLTRGHHPALDYADLPAFLVRLRGMEALSARALELLILTASRTSEVLKADWSEFNLENALWTIPAKRMKARRDHRIPLTGEALAVLSPLFDSRVSEFVFPGQTFGKPLSEMSMEMLLRRMKIEGVTVHGFRSSFRDWAGDQTSFPREVAEGCLAHSVGSNVELAYRRSDALEKRRRLMEAWADYCSGREAGKVVRMFRQ